MLLSESIKLNQSFVSQNFCVSEFSENKIDSTPSNEADFTNGLLAGIFLTIFMRFYFSTSVSNHKGHNIQFLNSKTSRYIFALVCLLFSTVLIPLLTLVILTFGSYRFLVHFILKKKYGHKYGGLISGRDVIWLIEDQSKNMINGLMIVEEREGLNKTVPEAVRDRIIREVTVGNLRDSKFSSTIHRELGYIFLLKDTVHPSEYISEFDTDDPNQEFMTHEDLRKKMSEVGNLPLPKNHSVFMEVLIGKKPIIWKKNDKKKCYACIFKVQHSLADGICILQILTNCFTDGPVKVKETLNGLNNNNIGDFDKENNNCKKDEEKIRKESWKEVLKTFIKFLSDQLLTYVLILVFGPTTVAIQLWMRPTDKNALHGPELSGRKELYWKTEDNEELVELTKSLRKRIPGAAFLDVLFTAFSASFREYFEKKSKPIPKYLTTVIPARLNIKDVEQLETDKFVFTNNFTVGLFNFPIDVPQPFHLPKNKQTLIPRLTETMKQTKMLRHSIDFYINFWVMTVFNAVLPTPLLYPLFRFPKCSMIISNLPGPPAFTVFDKMILKDLIFWLPNRGFIGVGVSCLSYDHRFQLGLIVDKALFSEEDNMQAILDNVPKYLKILEKETTLGVVM